MAHHLSKRDWSDPERIPHMVDSYEERYGPAFWTPFIELVGPEKRRVIADFGCGPGMFLRDAAAKFMADELHGFDASKYMLKAASKILTESIKKGAVFLEVVDFDKQPIEIEPASVDLGFSGYMLHEVADPKDLVNQIARSIHPEGEYAVFDFISGNEEAFVKAFMERGMTEVNARKRYPHMCKHSATDIENLLLDAGFSSVIHTRIDEIRVIAVGRRE